jgi:hypothetical protein
MGYDVNNFPVQTYVGCIKQQYIIRYTWYVISTRVHSLVQYTHLQYNVIEFTGYVCVADYPRNGIYLGIISFTDTSRYPSKEVYQVISGTLPLYLCFLGLCFKRIK